jgi:diguanylate cyclase (GGDEF)-like protein/PAS domain S-box-containing protein
VPPKGLDSHEVLDGLSDIVIVVEPDGTLAWANRAADRTLGWHRKQWIGRNVLELVHPDDEPLVLMSLDSMTRRFGAGSPIDIRVVDSRGDWRYLEALGTTLDDGRLTVVLRDTTERRSTEVSADDDLRFRALVHYSAAITMLLDETGRVTSLNSALTRLTGLDADAVKGTRLSEWVLAEAAERLDRDLDRALFARRGVVETAFPGHDGRPVHIEFRTVNLLDDPVVGGVLLSGHDVTELITARQELEQLAHSDTLTGVANRAALTTHLDALLRSPQVDNVAVVFVDLDRFKPVNDLYGHDAGDRLLIEVAERLVDSVRPDDLVARFGGDEFVVVATGVATPAQAAKLTARIEQAVTGVVHLGRFDVRMQASVGMAMARPGRTAGEVLADADAAMYAVKEARRGTRSVELVPEERRWIVDELPRAIERRELVVYYQPIVSLPDARVLGYEALVRWDHPERGLVEPSSFLHVAEEAGLAPAIGEVVIGEALAFIAEVNERADPTCSITVNLSASQFHDPALPGRLRQHLTVNRLDPALVWVEISESAELDRQGDNFRASTEESVAALVRLGVGLMVDDFGTGYASLIHLRRLPAGAIKIDRSFVSGVETDTADSGIVSAMVQLGALLGLEVIAEGVETRDQMDALVGMSCPMAQGYLFGGPRPAMAWLEEATPRPVPTLRHKELRLLETG